MMDTLENAQRRSEYWKAEHAEACAEIERLKQSIAELEGLCRQLYKAEETKHQQDWTAAIRALEKVGADSTALERPTVCLVARHQSDF